MRVPQVSERIKEAPAQALRGVFAGIGQLLLVTDKLRNKIPAGQHAPRARTPGAAATVADPTATRPAHQRGEPAVPSARAAAGSPARPAAEPAARPAAEPPARAAAGSAARPAAGSAAAASATAEAATKDAAAAEAVTEKPATEEPATAKTATAKTATTRRAPAKPATTKRAPAGPSAAKPAAAKPARRPTAGPSPAEPAAAEPPKPPKRQSTRDLDKTGNVRLLGVDAGPAAGAAGPAAGAAVAALGAAPPLPNYDELSLASLRARLRNLDVAQVRQLADYERTHAARADVLTMFERRIAKLEAEA